MRHKKLDNVVYDFIRLKYKLQCDNDDKNCHHILGVEKDTNRHVEIAHKTGHKEHWEIVR